MNSMANRYPFAASASCATRSAMNPGWDNPNPKYGYKGKNPLKSIMQVLNRTSLIFSPAGTALASPSASSCFRRLPCAGKRLVKNSEMWQNNDQGRDRRWPPEIRSRPESSAGLAAVTRRGP